MIGTVRDPVRKANASRWEFQAFNAMLHFEKKTGDVHIKISLLVLPGSKLSA